VAVNVLAFDIETVPDVDAGRRLLDLDGIADEQVADVLFRRQRDASGSEFLRHHLHRVVAIAAVLRSGERFQVWSLGEPGSSEAELIRRFFEGVERYTPTLVSWNGSGFDLPVLHHRALLRGVVAARYWDTGEEGGSFRFNHYLNRFHYRHTDLMDVLAGYQPRASAPLHEIATLAGFPGKLGMDGAAVWERYRAGEIDAIRAYCEVDALNTYLLYLRFERMRGHLAPDAYDIECEYVRASLREAGRPHLDEFLRSWAQSATRAGGG
jgi:3'-5' exonuclease